MSFSSLLGQERTVRSLKALLSSGRIPPALIFHGPDGIGKSIAAKEFAKALNCTPQPSAPALQGPHPCTDSCNSCLSCMQINKGVHPDVRQVDSTFQATLREEDIAKQSHVRVETIREVLNEAQRKAMLSQWKVFIIHEANTLVPAAANAMLKLLEEPPEYTLWILLSRKKDSLLPTIVSRCQSVEFRLLPKNTVQDILMGQALSSDEAANLAGLSGGSVEKALKIRSLIEKLSELDSMDPLYPFQVSRSMGRDLVKSREQAGLLVELLVQDAHRKWLSSRRHFARKLFANAIKKLLRYQKFLNQNVSPSHIIETAMIETEPLKLSFFQ